MNWGTTSLMYSRNKLMERPSEKRLPLDFFLSLSIQPPQSESMNCASVAVKISIKSSCINGIEVLDRTNCDNSNMIIKNDL